MSARSLRILVVDDYANSRELLRIILRAAGYEVEAFASGAEVLADDEKYIGLLLPPSVAAVVVNAALALDCRVAVNLNYTVSSEVMNACIDRGLSTEGTLPGGLSVKRRAAAIHKALQAELEKVLPGRALEKLRTFNQLATALESAGLDAAASVSFWVKKR